MKVTMLKSKIGFYTPMRPFKLIAGKVYILPNAVARTFIKRGIATTKMYIRKPRILLNGRPKVKTASSKPRRKKKKENCVFNTTEQDSKQSNNKKLSFE